MNAVVASLFPTDIANQMIVSSISDKAVGKVKDYLVEDGKKKTAGTIVPEDLETGKVGEASAE